MRFFTHQSPRRVTCFRSIHSQGCTSRGSFAATPLSASANTAYAVSHTGDMQGCMRKVVSSSMPSFSNSSIARITCGSSSEYPRQRSAMMEFMMPG